MKNVFRAIAALLLTTCVLYLITLTAAKVRFFCDLTKFVRFFCRFILIFPDYCVLLQCK